MTAPASRGCVLVVDDDDATRTLLLALLRAHGYQVEDAASGERALERLAAAEFDLVLLDINLPGMNGLEVLTAAETTAPLTEFIMITAFDSVDMAVSALKRGAYDFLRKPLQTEQLLVAVQRAVASVMARRDLARLKRNAAEGIRQRMLGTSPAMEQLWDRIEKVAPTRATVLITGETGVGKELVARAIHELSPRVREPFVATNGSSLPETLLESELFGHVKGSFTGALSDRRGLFEEANKGTLFLDELSTISAGVQVKLLRVVQERVIQRVGSNTPIPVDLRLLAATNVDLARVVEDGAFREDLYYRLNVFPIHVPPLRDRLEDLPLLVRHFVHRAAAESGIEPPAVSRSTLRAMGQYHWPGNVRQLENYVESAVIAQSDGEIGFTPPETPRLPRAAGSPGDVSLGLDDLERERVFEALARTGGHRARAARLLGIDRRTIYRKLKQYRTETPTTREDTNS
jgi:DNA-binding NtrC family response regulator